MFSARFSDLFCTLHQTTLRRPIRIPISMNLNGGNTTTTSGNSDTNEVCLWRTSELLKGCHTVGSGYACIVLNRPIQVSPPIVKKIWQNAQIRCLIDGGANHWNEFMHMHCEGEKLKLPEYITGDFDSITEETRKLFSAPDIKYQHTPNQNETDFTKALRFLQPQMKSEDIQEVIVFQENTGRLDQIMANINTLFKLQSDLLNIYLLSSACLSWLLLPGKHKIIIPKELVHCQRWCALIPVGSRANSVTTTGLKWNLSKSPMEFGHMVSTSNTYAAQEVCIETDSGLIWSMGLWAQND
ncbi:thiamin pyrophosphokinase 1-like [Rhagoletis pomonella]|uniref:thiamin pyrophosphokinase 1-like n=2 Tax=Rhagoletis pomonella TaxID=28610 RepID=UPI001785EF99|nr:thiamin pyrophosphokinase 1-like [Rhagoletis pomonella]XP_036343796.1 thiamin pyrophosphokinase 1-like [Rhagoletis pomonella]